MLVVIWPRMAYAALLSHDTRYIIESAPIMKDHAPPGAPTADVVVWYRSRGAECRLIPSSYAQ